MKIVKLFLLTATCIIAANLNAQNIDEIIAKHIEAIGGKEKLSKLKTVKMEASLTVQGMEIPIVITQVHNVGQRVDISAMGMNGYVITTPKEGWQYMPFQGATKAEAMPEEMIKENADELDIQSQLLDYKEKGHSVELLGKDTTAGKQSYKLKFSSKAGKVSTLYIDPTNYYIVRTFSKVKVNGQEMDQVIELSNHKKTEDGYVFPNTIGGAFGQGDLTVTKIEVNKSIDETIFKPSN